VRHEVISYFLASDLNHPDRLRFPITPDLRSDGEMYPQHHQMAAFFKTYRSTAAGDLFDRRPPVGHQTIAPHAVSRDSAQRASHNFNYAILNDRIEAGEDRQTKDTVSSTARHG